MLLLYCALTIVSFQGSWNDFSNILLFGAVWLALAATDNDVRADFPGIWVGVGWLVVGTRHFVGAVLRQKRRRASDTNGACK